MTFGPVNVIVLDRWSFYNATKSDSGRFKKDLIFLLVILSKVIRRPLYYHYKRFHFHALEHIEITFKNEKTKVKSINK